VVELDDGYLREEIPDESDGAVPRAVVYVDDLVLRRRKVLVEQGREAVFQEFAPVKAQYDDAGQRPPPFACQMELLLNAFECLL